MEEKVYKESPEIPQMEVVLGGMKFKCTTCGSTLYHQHERGSKEFHCNGCGAVYETFPE